MSFITESRKAYKKVQEAEDHEISMARGELEAIADKATQLASMLQGKSDNGNPLEAWVQSKITKAKDYINSVSDYMMYNPKINESYELEETTFEKIYQMQQDGKTADDIAKELKLKPDLVKKVLGESKTISEGLSDTQIAQLKKEYDPLKGKTITTAQYQQLKNILFKLQDGDLEKLQKQNIPFASTGAGSILRVRKAPVKVTKVTVPGLEGMAEEKIPQDYLDYLRTIVLKNVDFYEVPPKQIIQSWRDEKNKDRFKGKMVDFKEEVELQEKPSIKQFVIFTSDKGTTHKEFSAYSEPELNKQIGDYLKQNPGYKVLKKEPVASVKEEVDLEEATPLQTGIAMMKTLAAAAGIKPATSNNGYQAIYDYKNGEGAFKGQGKKSYEQVKNWIYKNGYEVQVSYLKQILGEEAELKPVPSLEDSAKKHKVDVEVLKKQLEKGIKIEKEHTKDEKTAEKIALAHIDERPDYYDQLAKVEKQPVAESHFAIGQHVIYHGPKNPLTPIKAQIIGVANPQTGAYYQIKKADGETTYAAPDQMKLDEACWTGYKQVGLKKKGKRMVPNCVKEEKRLYIESIVAVKNKAEKSGMPYSILKQVYDRGMAAWKGGHRPGATQVQWALARVNSFVTKSSGTWGGADSDLAKKVKGD
jgi:hypothetical protein